MPGTELVPLWNSVVDSKRMERLDTSQWPCTIARAAQVLGDRWNVLLIRQACLGHRKFEEFQQSLGIGRGILTARLAGLVDEGILVKVPYQDRPVRHEYRLTDRGRDAYSVLAALSAWGERWTVGPEGSPTVLHHTSCEHDMVPQVVCGHCHAPVDVRQVRVRPGPGYRSPRTDPSTKGST